MVKRAGPVLLPQLLQQLPLNTSGALLLWRVHASIQALVVLVVLTHNCRGQPVLLCLHQLLHVAVLLQACCSMWLLRHEYGHVHGMMLLLLVLLVHDSSRILLLVHESSSILLLLLLMLEILAGC